MMSEFVELPWTWHLLHGKWRFLSQIAVLTHMVRSTLFRWPIGRQIGKRGVLQNPVPDPLCPNVFPINRWPNQSSRIWTMIIFCALSNGTYAVAPPGPQISASGPIWGTFGGRKWCFAKSVTWTCQMVFKSPVVTPGHGFDVLRVSLLIFMTFKKSCFFPNRSLLLRVLMVHQRVGTQKHTQTVQRSSWSAGQESQDPYPKNTSLSIKPMVF